MKRLSIVLVFALAGCSGVPSSDSAPAPQQQHRSGYGAATYQAIPADSPETLGKVQAMIVVGNVTIVSPDGAVSQLKRGQIFQEGTKIVAAKGGNALLVLSNGATMKVKEGTVMNLIKYRQAPFNEQSEGTFLRLSKDPSRSNVLIELENGSFQGEVKRLNKDAGSTFVVFSSDGRILQPQDFQGQNQLPIQLQVTPDGKILQPDEIQNHA